MGDDAYLHAPGEELPPRKPCEDCKGSGKKPLKYLGEVTDPCPSCAGSGTIEVVEEKLTPWQQQIEDRLKRIEEWSALQRNGIAGGDSPEVTAKCQQIIHDFIMKDRSL